MYLSPEDNNELHVDLGETLERQLAAILGLPILTRAGSEETPIIPNGILESELEAILGRTSLTNEQRADFELREGRATDGSGFDPKLALSGITLEKDSVYAEKLLRPPAAEQRVRVAKAELGGSLAKLTHLAIHGSQPAGQSNVFTADGTVLIFAQNSENNAAGESSGTLTVRSHPKGSRGPNDWKNAVIATLVNGDISTVAAKLSNGYYGTKPANGFPFQAVGGVFDALSADDAEAMVSFVNEQLANALNVRSVPQEQLEKVIGLCSRLSSAIAKKLPTHGELTWGNATISTVLWADERDAATHDAFFYNRRIIVRFGDSRDSLIITTLAPVYGSLTSLEARHAIGEDGQSGECSYYVLENNIRRQSEQGGNRYAAGLADGEFAPPQTADSTMFYDDYARLAATLDALTMA